ncbi:hypothetical protein HNR06_000735 [Nocardiopsis arvandica]|uniref:DUF4878 domain-containing protein n=1 Tax=Nocardiopsis sinuspersici TaxID=501010 RepID=A0A7Y9X8I3_9ACTN|nr:hypothetical protein [Nocardiopsis sinuspersici]NYH51146.1 hypothetical protein [Nocardiopsis sinuspersici]
MRRSPLFTLPLALLLAVTACSGEETGGGDAGREAAGQEDGDVPAEALRAAEGFVASLQAADGEAGCALMDEAARKALADAHGAADCAAAFPPYAESLQNGEGVETGETAMSTDLGGDTSIVTVTLVHPEEDHGSLELRQDSDGQWVATRLPGVSLGGA